MGAGGARRAVLALRPALEPACSRVACSLWSLGPGGLQTTSPTAPCRCGLAGCGPGARRTGSLGKQRHPHRGPQAAGARASWCLPPKNGAPGRYHHFFLTNAMHEHEGWGQWRFSWQQALVRAARMAVRPQAAPAQSSADAWGGAPRCTGCPQTSGRPRASSASASPPRPSCRRVRAAPQSLA